VTVWRIVGAVGRTLVGFGILVLLFTAYLLWGTGLSESSHQHDLRHQFDKALSDSPTIGTSSPADPLAKELAAGNAPAEGKPLAELVIPKIGLRTVVVQGTGTDDLHLGPGHYTNTPLPGQPGNVAIAGHRTTYGAPFYNLNELQPGDLVQLTTLQGRFTYSVTRNFIVSPSDGSVLDTSATAMLTLTTCNPRFSASQRLVVQAALTSTPVPAPSPSVTPKKVKTSSQSLAGEQGAWGGAAAWGAGALALGVAAWFVARRRRRSIRWAVCGAAVLPVLVVLFFFFENVSPLLPASY